MPPEACFFSSPKYPDLLWGPPSLLINGYRGYFPGIKRPGRDYRHSPPSSVEIKNDWSYTSTPSVCLNGVDRGCTYLCRFWRRRYFVNRNFTSHHWLILRVWFNMAWRHRWLSPVTYKRKCDVTRTPVVRGVGQNPAEYVNGIWPNGRPGSVSRVFTEILSFKGLKTHE